MMNTALRNGGSQVSPANMNDDIKKIAQEAAGHCWHAIRHGESGTEECASIIESAIEKSTKAAYVQGYNDCDVELNRVTNMLADALEKQCPVTNAHLELKDEALKAFHSHNSTLQPQSDDTKRIIPAEVRMALKVLINHIEPSWDNCKTVVSHWLEAIDAAMRKGK